MKAFAMLGLDKIGFIEKERPVCGPYDAICRPLAISPCTSDVHTVWEHALGDMRLLPKWSKSAAWSKTSNQAIR